MISEKTKILIVEDDREINALLSHFLQENGYETVSAYDGRDASRRLSLSSGKADSETGDRTDREISETDSSRGNSSDYDLVLMDLMLPYKDGGSLIREYRKRSNTPVIVISAKSMMETKLEVLRLGADDYILKPFDLDEVLVRIEVALRHSGNAGESASGEREKVITIGNLTLYTDENRLVAGDNVISLTAKEFQILRLLMEYPDKTFTKVNLYETVWQDVYYYEDNTINVHVSNLRNKLKKATGKDYIETVWGIGYKLRRE